MSQYLATVNNALSIKIKSLTSMLHKIIIYYKKPLTSGSCFLNNIESNYKINQNEDNDFAPKAIILYSNLFDLILSFSGLFLFVELRPLEFKYLYTSSSFI